MHCIALPIGAIIVASVLLTAAAPAQARPLETWVSGTGTDAGDCPITAPCATFQYAHNRTKPGGTLNVLTPGSYGRLNINRAISIVADRVEALIRQAKGGAAMRVNAGANDVVSLRGLTIDLGGTDNDGISFVSGAALHVHNCVIRGINAGIIFMPASGTSELTVADSVFADLSFIGVWVRPIESGGAKAALDRVRVENASNVGIGFSGTATTGSITATVRDSVSAGTLAGIWASEDGGGTTVVTVDRSAAVNGTTGIEASGSGATIRIGDSTVSGNTTGLATSGGVIESYGTNRVDGNGTDGTPTSTITPK